MGRRVSLWWQGFEGRACAPLKTSSQPSILTAILTAMPLPPPPHSHPQDYLEAKATRMDHKIDQAYWSSSSKTPEDGAKVHEVVEHPPTVAPGGGKGAAEGGGHP